MKSFSSMTLIVLLFACSNSRTDNFPMDKPYWSVEDYDNAFSEIEFRTPEGDRYPALNNPETAIIFKKLTDQKNISVVAEDNSLGIRHRSEFTSNMFDEYRDLASVYQVMDREDKFVYDRELVEVLRFGLYLQIHYFKLGNDKILLESDNSAQVKEVIRRNEQTIISNFNNYLDFINHESSFSEESLNDYSSGVDESFSKLLETFPKANYNSMIKKATDMEKKAINSNVKTSIAALLIKLKNVMEVGTTTIQ